MSKTGRISAGGRNQTSSALIGAAVIHLIPGLLSWSLSGFRSDLNDWLRVGGFGMLVVMAIWARWSPLVPAILSASLYGAFLYRQLPQVPTWNVVMWIINAAILALLILAIVAATKRSAAEPPPT